MDDRVTWADLPHNVRLEQATVTRDGVPIGGVWSDTPGNGPMFYKASTLSGLVIGSHYLGPAEAIKALLERAP